MTSLRFRSGIEGFTLRTSSLHIGNEGFDFTAEPPELRTVRRCRFERTSIEIVTTNVINIDLRPTIEDCEFRDTPGAAIRIGSWIAPAPWGVQNIRPLIRNNVFVRCAGAFEHVPVNIVWDLHLTFANNTLVDSSADGMVFGYESPARLASVVVSNNLFAGGAGYGIREDEVTSEMTEIANNLFSGLALGAYLDARQGVLGTAAEVNALPGALDNLDAAPVFVDAAAEDYRLAAGSPGIDAARSAGAPPTDFAGDERPIDGDGDLVAVADVGADEHRPGSALRRNDLITALDPLTPERADVFPLRSPRDDLPGTLPPGGFEHPGVLVDLGDCTTG